jgi:hypothetical protein
LRNKEVRYLGMEIQPELRDDLHTRMILFGRACTLETLAT